LVLSGVVSSFYMKQIAQTVVMQLEAVHGVENRVEVLKR
jgi:osmotically-inducible protein OsmY